MNQRFEQHQSFARTYGLCPDGWQPLAADASMRRYIRIPQTPFGPCLLMDDASGTSNLEAYIRVARHLISLGLSAPVVHGVDLGAGLALIEDFGTGTYTNLLADGHSEIALYELAIDTLAALHNTQTGGQIDLPPYDMATLMREVMLFVEWFAPVMRPNDDLTGFRTEYDRLWRAALSPVATKRDTLVLRDYHVDNLMLLPGRSGVAACGLLDFQDGLIGTAAYDVMSLTQDARRDLSPGLEHRLLTRYFATRPDMDRAGFMQSYHLLAAQRHAKVAGIFQRLSRRDDKHHYLMHVPRVLRLLDRALDAAELAGLKQLMDARLPGWAGWTPG